MPLILVATTLHRFASWEGQTDFQNNIMLSAARQAVVEHGQVPLWNPYANGGTSFSNDPIAEHFSPTFLLHLLLGVHRGVIAEMVLFALVGGLGLALTARELGATRSAALLPAFVFSVSNSLPVYLVNGWFNHMAHAWLPLGMWLTIRASRRHWNDPRSAVLAGAVLGIVLLEADPYHVVYLVVWAAGLAFIDGARSKSLRPCRWLVWMALISALIGAARLVPIGWGESGFGSREWVGFSFTPAGALRALVTWDNSPTLWESVGYVGPVAAGLAILGFAIQRRRLWPLAVVAGVFGFYSLGSNIGIEAWSAGMPEVAPDSNGPSLARWHREWPILGSIRNPSRALVVVAMTLLPFSALGLDAIRDRLEARWAGSGRWVILVAIASAIGPAHHSARQYLGTRMKDLDLRLHERADTFRQVRWVPGPASIAPALNLGFLKIDLPFRTTPPGIRAHGEPEYLGPGWWTGDGIATLVRWSPNEMAFRIDGEGPGYLTVNQGFGSGWSAAGDAVVAEPSRRDGMLSVDGEAPGMVRLTYGSTAGAVGAWITGLAAAAVILWGLGPGRSGVRTARRVLRSAPSGSKDIVDS
ncbi:MAG: hypothetical protein CME06_11125 [Gemmatimonadetes bacterium]|nr:hypothetical protein [Gemmatimonadota bacterium]